MKTKFDLWFPRLWLTLALAALFGGLAWAEAQTNAATATNAVTNVPPPRWSLDTNSAALSFGLDRVPALQGKLFNVPLWHYVGLVLYILLALVVSKLLDYLLGVRLKKWAAKTATKWDDILLEMIHGPVKVIVFVFLLHIGSNFFSWPAWLAGYLARGLVIIVALSLTYLALNLAEALLAFWEQKAAARGGDKLLDEQLFPVLRIVLRAFVVIVAILLTSQNLGLNITSLLASLSIGALALGLAAQDTLANLFGAVSVFLDRPFKIGDRIRLDNVDGTVESIGLRSTRVRNLDGFLVTIPNKTMGNATITNITRRPNIKTEINFGLTYDTSLEKLKRAVAILEELYRGHPKTSDLLVSFNKFAESALNIQVVHWYNGADNKAYLADMQALNLAIKERFEREAIEMAFPTQTVYVKQAE